MKLKAIDITILVLAGIVLGLIFTALWLYPTKREIKCDDGMSEQVEKGVRIKTYTPALDTCKDK